MKYSICLLGMILLCLCACDSDITIRGAIVQPMTMTDYPWFGRVVALEHSARHELVAGSSSGGIFEPTHIVRNEDRSIKQVAWGEKGTPSNWSTFVQDIARRVTRPETRYVVTTRSSLKSENNGGIWIAGNALLSYRRPVHLRPDSIHRC